MGSSGNREGLTRRSRVLGRWARRSAPALLAVLVAAVPVPALARCSDILSTIPYATACQLSLSLQLGAPAGLVPLEPPAASVPYTISASGTCDPLTAPFPISISGSGTTVGAPTCGTFLSLDGSVSLSMGGAPQAMTVVIAASTVAPEWLMVMSSPSLSGAAGAGQLVLSTASLQACARTGGTTSLLFSGVVAVAG